MSISCHGSDEHRELTVVRASFCLWQRLAVDD